MEKAKKRTLVMHFQTKIDNGAHSDAYEFTTTGELYDKGGSSYIRFKEKLSETAKMQTTMKWNGKELLLIRQGDILMRQSFITGKETIGRYVTPEQAWETKAQTETLRVSLPEQQKQGKIELVYTFSLQGQPTGTHHLVLTLEEDIEK